MAQTAELRRRGSASYWLPRAATRAKPFQCRPFGVWRWRRWGGGLPGVRIPDAAASRCAVTSAIFLAALLTCHPCCCCAPFPSRASRTTPTYRRRVLVVAGVVLRRATDALRSVLATTSQIEIATSRLTTRPLSRSTTSDTVPARRDDSSTCAEPR